MQDPTDSRENPLLPDSQSEIDRWLSSLNEGRVKADLGRMEAELNEIEVRMKADLARAQTLRREIQQSRAALNLRNSLTHPATDAFVDITEMIDRWTNLVASRTAAAGSALTPETPPRGRASIRALMDEMNEMDEWTIPSVLRELVQRGWADEGDEHAVGVSLSRMARAGELDRPRKGVYIRPSITMEELRLLEDNKNG